MGVYFSLFLLPLINDRPSIASTFLNKLQHSDQQDVWLLLLDQIFLRELD